MWRSKICAVTINSTLKDGELFCKWVCSEHYSVSAWWTVSWVIPNRGWNSMAPSCEQDHSWNTKWKIMEIAELTCSITCSQPKQSASETSSLFTQKRQRMDGSTWDGCFLPYGRITLYLAVRSLISVVVHVRMTTMNYCMNDTCLRVINMSV